MGKSYFFNNVLALLLLDCFACLCIYLVCLYFDASWLVLTIGWIISVSIVIPCIVWKLQPKIQAIMNKKVIEDE